MAPTATSPPYFSKEELKHTEMILSLACMINKESPRARQGRITGAFSAKFCFLIRRVDLVPNKKLNTQMQEQACEIIVASAAPRTPIWHAKIKSDPR